MYQEYFGFTAEPFPTDLPPEKLYRGCAWHELEGRFEHLCTYRGVMLLTGSPGCGKTTALRSLLTKANRKLYHPMYLPLSTVSVFEFYRQINEALGGEEYYYKADIYRSIQQEVVTWTKDKSIVPILAIDEGHLLKEQNFKELQLIINFEMDSQMPLILIIAGHPSLARRLQSHSLESFNQRIALKYAMEPLKEVESKEFVRESIARVGGQPKIITDEACAVIYQKARGLPRLVGALTTKALVYCALGRKSIVDAEEVFVAAKELTG